MGRALARARAAWKTCGTTCIGTALIRVSPLIQAALMVDAPDMPLCRDDCAGLCPQCGANLNEGPCGCGEDPDLAAFEKQANPFLALADFKFE